MLRSATAVNTLADLFNKLENEARSDLFMVRRGARFEDISAARFVERTRRCAAALEALGVGRGERVGLICSNRPAWHVIDFACYLRGAVLVPLFTTLTAAQVRHIFVDSGCRVAFAEGAEQVDKVDGVRADLPELEHVVMVRPEAGFDDDRGTDRRALGDAGRADYELDDVLGRHDARADCPGPAGGEALATIIYTSGTTGEPKGVMLSHANLLSNIRGSMEVLACRAVDRSLSVLPLCHSFQRIVDYTFLMAGGQVAYAHARQLADEYLMVRPTVVAGVPRLFERFRAAVLEEVAAQSAWKQRVFGWAERIGRRRAQHELLGAELGMLDRARAALADLLVLRKVRVGAGGRIFHFVSGGAALDPSLNWWFESMGLRLLQGYGLTETSPVISANPHEANRIGTVGTPIPGVEVKIAADGEILTRGPHVMVGYWNKPRETEEMIVDGWLHTGDIGTFEDGYLSVTDREKHLLVTSTGKNVAPQPLENALAMSRYVDQVSVLGDGKRFIAALVVPDFAALEAWATGNGKRTDRAALCADAETIELIGAEIDRLQVDFASFERVRAFRLLAEPFSIEAGTLTPTLKPVRRQVQRRYAALIEEMYRESPPGSARAGTG